MLEADMFPLVKAWLERRGFTVFAEVYYKGHDIDVVGSQPGEQVCVELKMSFTQCLKRQLRLCKRATPWVFSCTHTTPRKTNQEWCEEMGMGVLVIGKTGKLAVLTEPERVGGRKYSWINTKNLPKGNIGGAPSGKDKHPALDAYNGIVAYMKRNPLADWNTVYNNVPNHYAHAKSMEASMKRYIEFSYGRLAPLNVKGHGSRKHGRRRGCK